ncbi:glycylpeptide N-tetradecanoyltransferase [Kalmusia sp. IMI 367209]|nr:glycylpeptide N-tetradecanoyltransferase [Kalmusia sp. IMI 367209]
MIQNQHTVKTELALVSNIKRSESRTLTKKPAYTRTGKISVPSLLGTWQGEPWHPGESTLLQVLVSIQAMIFCEEPMYNEPVLGPYQNQQNESAAYNQVVRGLAVRYAILNWLESPSILIAYFQFKQKAGKILETVQGWTR